MNEHTRKKLKLISSLTLALLSLFSAVTLTFSWFSHNRDVGGNDMGITIGSETKGIYLDHAFYRIDTTDTSDGYLFSEVDKSTASLGTYDVLVQSYQLLLKIYVDDTVDTLTISAITETTYFLGNPNKKYLLLGADPDNAALPDDADSEYTNALSSVVGFILLSSDDLSEETTASGTSYRLGTLPKGDMQTFVDKNDISESSKPENFDITISSDNMKTGETSPSGTSCKAVYLLLSYDPTLISSVSSVNIGNPAIQKDGIAAPIPFRSDFYLTLGAE